MVSMTRAGEAGGFLDVAMRQIADNFEAEVKLRGKIKAAMTYPVVVFVLAILMCVGMLVFVVPVFEDMFAGPRRRAAAADPGPGVRCRDAMKYLVPVRDRVAVIVLRAVVAQVRPHRAGPQRRRPAQAQAAGLRQALPEARAGPVRPQPRHPALLRRPDPAVARHRLGDHRLDRDLAGPSRRSRSRSAAASPSPARWPSTTVFPPMVVQMIASGEEAGAIDQMLDEDRGVLRRGGRGDHRVAHRPDRAADDRLPRRASSGR